MMSGGFPEGVWKVSGRCLEGTLTVLGGCNESNRKISGMCLDGIWNVSQIVWKESGKCLIVIGRCLESIKSSCQFEEFGIF